MSGYVDPFLNIACIVQMLNVMCLSVIEKSRHEVALAH